MEVKESDGGQVVVTIRIKGGLGNQLFQYAAAYSLAKRLNQKLELDSSFFPQQTLRGFKLGQMNILCTNIAGVQSSIVELYKSKYLNKVLRKVNIRVLPCGGGKKYLLEARSDIVPEFFSISQANIYMDGYYQSEEYFSSYKKELIKQFTPNYPSEQEYENVLSKIINCESVAVHVRRGDFLRAQNDSNPNHYLLGEQYYHNTLKYVNEHLENPVFFWFSDDIDWVKHNFGEKENFQFVSLNTKHADIDEMMLMKNCKHIITANSTFSWWASWLNEYEDALHICPAKRYGNLHMIPENWVKIGVE